MFTLSGFQLIVAKSKIKFKILWPITTIPHNSMNHSEFEANIVTGVKRGKTRASKSVGFGFASRWLRDLREVS